MKKASSKKGTKSKFSKPSQPPGLSFNRQVLFRPDRYKYVKKLIKDDGCVFCHAASQRMSFNTLCVYKSAHSMVVVNKYPYNTGHLLILPLEHKGSLLSLSDVEFQDLQNCVRFAMEAVQDLYQPMAMNLGLNQGRAAGAGIPDHLHYHLIPRWEADLNFFPLVANTKVVIEPLDRTFKRLQNYFKGRQP